MNIPILFSNCIPVQGSKNSIICDLQRHNYVIIPNDLFTILQKYRGLSIFEIKEKYENKFDDIIDEYFNILIKNEIAFLTDTPELFPEISKNWYSPFKVTNAIIDVKKKKNYLIKALKELDDLNCKFVQLRFFGKTDNLEILKILEFLDDLGASILAVDICLNYDDCFTDEWVEDFCINNRRLSSIIFYNSPKGRNISKYDGNRLVIHTSKKLYSEKNCGIIDKYLFSINIPNFTESLHHNSCLNRKISVDIYGNIKNCPSMSYSYGNISDTTLQEVLSKRKFKKYWNITKDEIKICKDCEFRYICTDCRAYTENPKDAYSKPLKCGYNPFTGKWDKWSLNPLKQNAIKYYEMQSLIQKDVE